MTRAEDPSLRDLAALLRHGFLWALLAGAIFASITFYLGQRQPTIYEASATLLATQTDQSVRGLDTSLATAPRIDALAYQTAAYSTPVREDTAARLEEPTDLSQVTFTVAVQQNLISSLISVRARGSDPSLTSNAANALAQALVAWDEGRATRVVERAISRLESQLRVLDQQILALGASDAPAVQAQRDDLITIRTQRLTELNLASTLRNSVAGSLDILELAPIPLAPIAPRPTRSAVIAFVFGVFLCYAALLLRNALDNRARSGSELEGMTGLPILAGVPRARRPGPRTPVGSVAKEAISYLHTNLDFMLDNRYPAAVVITSTSREPKHPSIARPLAESLARAGKRVLLVDAHPSRASLSKTLNPDGLRLTTLQHYLQEPEGLLEPLQIRAGDRYGFDFIPTLLEPAYHDDLLRQGLKRCIAQWQAVYDLVLFESPPVLSSADALILASASTLTLLCTDVRYDTAQQLLSGVSLLERSKTPTALVAFNLKDFTLARSRSPRIDADGLPSPVLPVEDRSPLIKEPR
jgi:capsular polysaccharide biosynthesis protein/Mrp family chromosome partitioning ATPase